MGDARVEVWRGTLVESLHRVSVAVVDAAGRLRASAGDPDLVAFARSALKPIQALALVEDGAADHFALTEEELAVCCASHSGEPRHMDLVLGMLERIGLEEAALVCGPHEPLHRASAAALREAGQVPGRAHNNCSGKHAGMLALARVHGWPAAGYHAAGHPVQDRMLAEVARWCEVPADEIPTAVDGCGVVTYALSMRTLASSFARLAASARGGDTGPSRIVQAMVRCPECVGGTDRLCTQLMRAAGGRIFAKVGAEGVYCAGIPGAELGVALKVEDGAVRAAEPSLLAVLRVLNVLTEEELSALASYAEPDLENTRGEVVGRIRAVVALEAYSE